MIKKIKQRVDLYRQRKRSVAQLTQQHPDIVNMDFIAKYYSSLVMECVAVIMRKLSKSVTGRCLIGVKFEDEVTIFHPITTREFGILSARADKDYLSQLSKFNQFSLSKGDVVIDIGAHVGSFCLPCSVNFGVKCFAFEPDQINYQCLLKAVQVNNLCSQVQVKQAAVAQADGEVEFLIGGTSTIGSLRGLGYFLKSPSTNITKVPSLRLKTIFSRYSISNCRLLKIDCEGAEHYFVEDLTEDLIQLIDYIAIEIHPVEHVDNLRITEILRKHFNIHEKFYEGSRGGEYQKIKEWFCENKRLKSEQHNHQRLRSSIEVG